MVVVSAPRQPPARTEDAGPGAAPARAARAGDARARLLEAAVEALAARGFHGTTTRDIAAAAGMSPAALYVHHRSKEDVLFAISRAGHERTLAVVEAAVATSTDPAERLGRLAADFVRHHALAHTTARVLNYEIGALSPEHRAEIDELRRAISACVVGVLADGRQGGAFHVDDVRMTAAALLSLGIDLARWYDEAGGWGPEELASHYRELALRMVGVGAT